MHSAKGGMVPGKKQGSADNQAPDDIHAPPNIESHEPEDIDARISAAGGATPTVRAAPDDTIEELIDSDSEEDYAAQRAAKEALDAHYDALYPDDDYDDSTPSEWGSEATSTDLTAFKSRLIGARCLAQQLKLAVYWYKCELRIKQALSFLHTTAAHGASGAQDLLHISDLKEVLMRDRKPGEGPSLSAGFSALKSGMRTVIGKFLPLGDKDDGMAKMRRGELTRTETMGLAAKKLATTLPKVTTATLFIGSAFAIGIPVLNVVVACLGIYQAVSSPAKNLIQLASAGPAVLLNSTQFTTDARMLASKDLPQNQSRASTFGASRDVSMTFADRITPQNNSSGRSKA